MKICQYKNKVNISFIKYSIFIIVFFIFLISAKNILAADIYKPGAGLQGMIKAIITKAPGTEAKVGKFSWKTMVDQIKTWAIKEALVQLKKSGDIAWRQALKFFLNTLAYDTATYLATGDKGQLPMFETEGWGGYLKNVADNTAGSFIEQLGQNMGTLKFNLCQPNIDVQLRIGLGLLRAQRPKKPECTFSKMVENWDEALSDPDFLNKFQDMFNPWSNDLGIALTLQTGIESEISSKVNTAAQDRIEGQGFKAVTESISGFIKSPSRIVMEAAGQPIRDSTASEKIHTGTILADAIDIFINTLAGKLIDKWLKKGLITDFPDNSYDWSKLGDYSGSPTREGIAGAKERLRSLIEPNFAVRGDYNILAELTMCPDPNKAGPTNCVIDSKFSQAISEKKTVGQALSEGYLNPNGIFGFSADGLEPRYNEGYPYRTMIILRKFRILPMGWELAAQYIKDNPNNIDGTKNLADLVNCYSADDDYQGYNAGWCAGLVDPNWVLKAPLNYCKREGAGPEIQSEQVVGEGYSSQLAISRNDKYCADEQSCIKENFDGSCQLYGYCSEERRTWNFNAKACEPRHNTCQTFRGSGGQTVSYLENTLDYGICSIDNVGCQAYCADYDYASAKFTCTNSTGNKIYLDKDAEVCESDNEGCSELIRLKSGSGANLLTNSSFEDDLAGTIWAGAGAQVDDGYDGVKALQLSNSLNKAIAVGPADYSIAGEGFSLSFYAKNCSLGDNYRINGQVSSANLNQGADWQRYQTNYIFPTSAINNVNIIINSSSCLIDAIKLERGRTATAYSNYRASGLIYEKLAPSYLNCSGPNPPDECSRYAQTCQVNEVGCELYTSVKDDISVPAQVRAIDYCPAECVGYDTYIQSETAFDSLRDSYFIPSTAKTCSAEAVGCDEFTNLDKLGQGAEAREYYSYLRRCIKPSQDSCAEFYTWEGSDEAGFQLKVLTLQKAGSEPAVTENDSQDCNQAIYNLASTDPSYNADCRQFYNRQGELSYHLYKRTISCSDNCHPYRRTVVNDDPTITAAGSCSGNDRHWDSATSQCLVCKGNGEWNSQHQACIYMAIPGEGATCSAMQAGCRDYSGNTGNNLYFILNNDFEDGSTQGWSGLGGTTVRNSNEALTVGGHSLEVSGGSPSAAVMVGPLVTQGKPYVLSFLAKAASANTKLTSVKLINDSNQSAAFATTAITSDWRFYKVNLADLNHQPSAGEKLVITADNNFYLDDVRLTEVVDRYFLIKDSWVTPASCDEDHNHNPAPLYMLGCEAYQDRDNKIHNLRSFSSLCSEAAVGCELMIDTSNSADYRSQTFNNGDASEIVVPADEYKYVVYDKNKQCNAADKGCQRLGKPYQYGDSMLYSDVYLKNNPDKYNEILCVSGAVGCAEWATSEGSSYFKDPGDMVCDWRQGVSLASGSWGWYKKKIKRCGNDSGTVCLSDKDCAAGVICQIETADNQCDTDLNLPKTFGVGGQGNLVEQPANNWVGLCSAADAGCSEYIDPISRFSANLLFNPNFTDIDGDGFKGDGWKNSSQEITLDGRTLYLLARQATAGKVDLTCATNIYELKADNSLAAGTATLSLAAGVDRSSKIFWTTANNSCTITASNFNGEVELKKVLVNYQLKQELDKQGCNAIVDFEQGCVLFNERSASGSGMSSLNWDADLTVSDANGLPPASGALGERDANSIIKVSPDRVCNKWLACRSYIKDEKGNNVCFDIGLCDSVDANGNCNSYVITKQVNQIYPTSFLDQGGVSNLSGYAKAGYYADNSLRSDYYSLGAMKQVGEQANVANNSFEYASSNGYPIGWVYEGGNWDANVFKVIDNPIEAQVEGIGYAPEGTNFLKLGSSFSATSEFVDVVSSANGTKYVLTTYINTVNLKSGSAKIKIEGFNSTGQSQGEIALTPAINLASGSDWTFKLGQFTINNLNISHIKITLYSDSSDKTQGNFYYDDIRISAALNSKTNWFTPQSCRLYPKTDSLSCNYYEDSGKYQKGWSGYCLEYDRWPGSSNACLLWWPVDKVKGEGVEEGAGYIGKIPVYYCLEAKSLIPVEYRETAHVFTGCAGDDPRTSCTHVTGFTPPDGYVWANDKGFGPNAPPSAGCGRHNGGWDCDSQPSGTCYYDCVTTVGSVSGWYMTNGTLDTNFDTDKEKEKGIKYYDPFSKQVYDDIPAYCTKVVQTVNSVGDNKYWSSKVYSGSDYIVPDLNYKYNTDYAPFGAIVEPYPSSNPYEWDGSGKDGIQPLYVKNSEARASHPYKIDNPVVGFYGVCQSSGNLCLHAGDISADQNKADCPAGDTCQQINFAGDPIDKVKRLFAQSYGGWEWSKTDSRYITAQNLDWGLPTTICPGGTRPAYPNDYCAIPPAISNIKVNNNIGNLEIVKNQFVNLTFNSLVDSQQLPMVMYAVDWGDGEQTIVTGVEMRSRPNEDNPHSLYHLYSYWDLKSKYNSGVASISCTADQCTVKPKVQIKDNWGWCNNSTSMNDCGYWQAFGGTVVVKEK